MLDSRASVRAISVQLVTTERSVWPVRKPLIQEISVFNTRTWRKSIRMPTASTPRITALNPQLAMNALCSGGNNRTQIAATMAR